MPQNDKGKNVSVTSPFTGFPYVYLKKNKWFIFFTFSTLYYKTNTMKILLSIAYTGDPTRSTLKTYSYYKFLKLNTIRNVLNRRLSLKLSLRNGKTFNPQTSQQFLVHNLPAPKHLRHPRDNLIGESGSCLSDDFKKIMKIFYPRSLA